MEPEEWSDKAQLPRSEPQARHEFPILKTVTMQLKAGIQHLFDAYQSDSHQGGNRTPDMPTDRRYQAVGFQMQNCDSDSARSEYRPLFDESAKNLG